MLMTSKMERSSFLCMELFQKYKRRLRGSCAVTGGSDYLTAKLGTNITCGKNAGNACAHFRIGDDEAFFLHPGMLALATTLESVKLPANIIGWLDGRSSLARLGLMVHVTAHRIDPGWEGKIVLEFYNSGKLPLALRPNMVIGALSFEVLSGPAARPYTSRKDAKYKHQQNAVASRINED